MPFVSESQRRKFYAMANRGEISKKKVKEWEDATPDKKLPERVEKKARFGGIERQLDELGLSDAQKALIIGGGGAAMLGSHLLFRPKSKDHEKKAALFEAMGKHAAAVVVNAIGAKGVGKRRTKNETKLLEEAGSDGSDQPKVESNLLAGMKTGGLLDQFKKSPSVPMLPTLRDLFGDTDELGQAPVTAQGMPGGSAGVPYGSPVSQRLAAPTLGQHAAESRNELMRMFKQPVQNAKARLFGASGGPVMKTGGFLDQATTLSPEMHRAMWRRLAGRGDPSDLERTYRFGGLPLPTAKESSKFTGGDAATLAAAATGVGGLAYALNEFLPEDVMAALRSGSGY